MIKEHDKGHILPFAEPSANTYIWPTGKPINFIYMDFVGTFLGFYNFTL